MRIDAPACLNTKIEVIRIEENQIVLSAFGIVSHQPIRYETRINLYQPIVPNLSTYKIEAVGTLYFNLTKLEPSIYLKKITIIILFFSINKNQKSGLD